MNKIWDGPSVHGIDITQETLVTSLKLDNFVPINHPLRALKAIFNQVLKEMEGKGIQCHLF